MNFKQLGRRLLWCFLAFHIAAIVLIPNGNSYLNATLAPVLLPYVNQINMNNPWQFFSPDPGPATYLISKITLQNGEVVEDWMPPEKDEFTFRQFFNRRVAAMRFIAKDPKRAKQVLIPYLCTKYENAASVSIEKVLVGVPSLNAVQQGQALNDMSGRVAAFFAAGDCERGELVE